MVSVRCDILRWALWPSSRWHRSAEGCQAPGHCGDDRARSPNQQKPREQRGFSEHSLLLSFSLLGCGNATPRLFQRSKLEFAVQTHAKDLAAAVAGGLERGLDTSIERGLERGLEKKGGGGKLKSL